MARINLTKRYFTPGKPLGEIPLISETGISKEEAERNFAEFEEYEKKNYSTSPLPCLCGNDDSYKISEVDREGYVFPLVICNSCGLIRAQDYWNDECIEDYYANRYRQKYEGGIKPTEENLSRFFEAQVQHSKEVYKFVKDFITQLPKSFETFDIGGGAGGGLKSFEAISSCTLVDFNKNFLNFASKKGFNIFEGGIEEIGKVGVQPDLVILSHVIEHIPDLNDALRALKENLKLGSFVYIEVPSIDALNHGDYYHDFLLQIHKPHCYYFSVNVLNNLMERHGFDVLSVNHKLAGLYQFNNNTKDLRNCHDEVVGLIKKAEIKRKFKFLYFSYFIAKVKKLFS